MFLLDLNKKFIFNIYDTQSCNLKFFKLKLPFLIFFFVVCIIKIIAERDEKEIMNSLKDFSTIYVYICLIFTPLFLFSELKNVQTSDPLF